MLTTLSALSAHAQKSPPPHRQRPLRVAVFAEPGFPTWLMNGDGLLPPPTGIVARLQSLGIPAETVNAAILADSARFNSDRYALLVLPYGNCYPQAALQNMQAFHHEGGGLVTTGIPFTHAVVFEPGVAEGWDANPGWGEKAHVLPGQGPNKQNVLAVTGRDGDWSGGNSSRFPVQPGMSIEVSALAQDDGARPEFDDQLFVRFFDKSGAYIGQEGMAIAVAADWLKITRNVTVPPNAVAADLSPQIQNRHRTIYLCNFFASIDGRTNLIRNPALTAVHDHWRDIGDQQRVVQLFGPGGIGVGTYGGPDPNTKTYAPSPDDPLHLRDLNYIWKDAGTMQWFDPGSLPEEDTIIPLVGTRGRPLAALVVHHDADADGAIDVWTYMGPDGQRDITGSGQMIIRGVIAALAQSNLLTPTRAQSDYTTLTRLLKPTH